MTAIFGFKHELDSFPPCLRLCSDGSSTLPSRLLGRRTGKSMCPAGQGGAAVGSTRSPASRRCRLPRTGGELAASGDSYPRVTAAGTARTGPRERERCPPLPCSAPRALNLARKEHPFPGGLPSSRLGTACAIGINSSTEMKRPHPRGGHGVHLSLAPTSSWPPGEIHGGYTWAARAPAWLVRHTPEQVPPIRQDLEAWGPSGRRQPYPTRTSALMRWPRAWSVWIGLGGHEEAPRAGTSGRWGKARRGGRAATLRSQPQRCNPGEVPPARGTWERLQPARTCLGGCACPGQGQGRGNRVPRLGISL